MSTAPPRRRSGPRAESLAASEIPLTPEHRELRRRHVGSSEVASLFNISPYATRLELYLRKRGELPEPDLSAHEPALWGQALEGAIGQAVGDRMRWTVRKVRRYTSHPEVPGMGCSLDFEIVDHPRGAGVLEVKTVDRQVFRTWGDGRPPIHYELQLQHQLACTRRDWGAIGVLIGGNELRVVPYERHAGAITRLESEVPVFWREVQEQRPPRPDYQADLATLAALYRHAKPGSFLDLRRHARARELCREHLAAADAERAARQRREAAKAELLHLIGDAETVWLDGFKILAGTVEGGPVEYVREPYRSFRITPRPTARTPAHASAQQLQPARS
jgi:putative phage-type endonuclease